MSSPSVLAVGGAVMPEVKSEMAPPPTAARETSGSEGGGTPSKSGKSGKSGKSSETAGQKKPSACQVAGCSADMTKLKEYNQRFKICRVHQQADIVVREDEPHRFCQQCARFHSISVFDGVKRSCRTSLEQLNERRRKLKTARKGASQSFSQGAARSEDGSQFSNRTSSADMPKGAASEAAQRHMQPAGNLRYMSASEGGAGALQRFQRQSNCAPDVDDLDPCVPMRDLGKFAGIPCSNPMSTVHSMWASVHNTEDSALPALPGARKHRQQAGQPMDSGDWGGGCQPPPPQQMDPFGGGAFHDAVFDQMEPNGARRHSMAALQPRQPDAMQPHYGFGLEEGPELPLGPRRLMRHTWGANAPPGQSTFEADLHNMGILNYGEMRSGGSASGGAFSMARDASMSQPARDVEPAVGDYPLPDNGFAQLCNEPMQAGVPPSLPASSTLVYHVSMKLFGAKPDDLPFNLRPKILSWLQDVPVDVEGSIRPGCVHLTVSLTFASAEHYTRALESVPAGIMASLREAGPGCPLPWCTKDTGIWLPDRWMSLRAGRVVASGWHEAPGSCAVEAPVATTSSGAVRVSGTGLVGRGCRVLCRMSGRYQELPVTWVKDERGEPAAVASLPRSAEGGLAWLEVLHEPTTSAPRLEMSHPKPVLVCQSAAIAADVSAIWTQFAPRAGHDGVLLLQVLDSLLHRRASGHVPPPAACVMAASASAMARRSLMWHLCLSEYLARVADRVSRAKQPLMARTLSETAACEFQH